MHRFAQIHYLVQSACCSSPLCPLTDHLRLFAWPPPLNCFLHPVTSSSSRSFYGKPCPEIILSLLFSTTMNSLFEVQREETRGAFPQTLLYWPNIRIPKQWEPSQSLRVIIHLHLSLTRIAWHCPTNTLSGYSHYLLVVIVWSSSQGLGV